MKPKTITLQGKKFASGKDAGDCDGRYIHRSHGPVELVIFTERTGEPFAAAVRRDGVSWFVTAHWVPGTRQTRYMFALCDVDARKLGVDSLGYRQKRDAAAAVMESLTQATQGGSQ